MIVDLDRRSNVGADNHIVIAITEASLSRDTISISNPAGDGSDVSLQLHLTLRLEGCASPLTMLRQVSFLKDQPAAYVTLRKTYRLIDTASNEPLNPDPF